MGRHTVTPAPVWRWDQAVTHLAHLVDADTFDLGVLIDAIATVDDLDLQTAHVQLAATYRYRPVGIDAPEVRDVLGPAATDATRAWFRDHPTLRVQTWKRDSFGRRLCRLYDPTTGVDLATHLLTVGAAVEYHLRNR